MRCCSWCLKILPSLNCTHHCMITYTYWGHKAYLNPKMIIIKYQLSLPLLNNVIWKSHVSHVLIQCTEIIRTLWRAVISDFKQGLFANGNARPKVRRDATIWLYFPCRRRWLQRDSILLAVVLEIDNKCMNKECFLLWRVVCELTANILNVNMIMSFTIITAII